MSTIPIPKKNNAIISVIIIGLLVGTLDGIAAIIWSYCYTHVISLGVFKGVASGIFGSAAFSGGSIMIFYGILLHYLIAFIFTTALFLLYPFFNFLLKNKYIVGLLYGIVIWAIMNLVVSPLSNALKPTLSTHNIIIGILILIVCVGLPIAIISNNHYYRVKGRLLYL